MDRIDLAIMTHLQDNARISNVDLATRVGLSPSACLRRVAQLEDSGIIDGYHANLNAAKLGHDVLVLVHITLRGQSDAMMAEFEQAVGRIILRFLIAGANDYILRVAARDVEISVGAFHLPVYIAACASYGKHFREVINRGIANRRIPNNLRQPHR